MSVPTVRALGVVLALSVALGGCASDQAPAPAPTASPSPTAVASPTPSPTPAPTGPARPLNGVPVRDPSSLERRVVAVKVDNHREARPQVGLDRADAVVELLVEAGLTRFIALYHTDDAERVGPMRSGRPTDPAILGPLGAVFAISGAQDWVLAGIRAAGVPVIGEIGPPATSRSSERRSPHNLFADTHGIRTVADERGYADEPPPAWFRFGPWSDDVGEPAEDVLLRWSDTTTVTWRWTGEGYQRQQDGAPHVVVGADGTTGPVTADTLVVLLGDRYVARPPGRGTPVPALDTVGGGPAAVFAGGRVQEGTWTRDDATEPFRLATLDGDPLPVPPGRLWVSVFPDDRRVSW